VVDNSAVVAVLFRPSDFVTDLNAREIIVDPVTLSEHLETC